MKEDSQRGPSLGETWLITGAVISIFWWYSFFPCMYANNLSPHWKIQSFIRIIKKKNHFDKKKRQDKTWVCVLTGRKLFLWHPWERCLESVQWKSRPLYRTGESRTRFPREPPRSLGTRFCYTSAGISREDPVRILGVEGLNRRRGGWGGKRAWGSLNWLVPWRFSRCVYRANCSLCCRTYYSNGDSCYVFLECVVDFRIGFVCV